MIYGSLVAGTANKINEFGAFNSQLPSEPPYAGCHG
jgi:hypothetical protein